MKIHSNGIGINVEEQGSGNLTLVFLHHWGGSTHTWSHAIVQLAKSYRTIALDHRGWGESDSPATGYALADHTADILGALRVLRVERYILIGNSMGGKVAQFVAAGRRLA